jgi:hypothetical protein
MQIVLLRFVVMRPGREKPDERRDSREYSSVLPSPQTETAQKARSAYFPDEWAGVLPAGEKHRLASRPFAPLENYGRVFGIFAH